MSYAIEEIAPLIKEWTINTRLPEVIAEMTRRYYYRAVIEQSELSIQAEIYKCKNDPAHWFNHWVVSVHSQFLLVHHQLQLFLYDWYRAHPLLLQLALINQEQ